MTEDALTTARARLARLLAERDQVRARARAAVNPMARQTYSCRMLELVGEVNTAIAAVDGLAAPARSGVARLDLSAELAALAPPPTASA